MMIQENKANLVKGVDSDPDITDEMINEYFILENGNYTILKDFKCKEYNFGDENVTILLNDILMITDVLKFGGKSIEIHGGKIRTTSLHFSQKDVFVSMEKTILSVDSCDFSNINISFSGGIIYCQTMISNSTNIQLHLTNLIIGKYIVHDNKIKIKGDNVFITENLLPFQDSLSIEMSLGYTMVLSNCFFKGLRYVKTTGNIKCENKLMVEGTMFFKTSEKMIANKVFIDGNIIEFRDGIYEINEMEFSSENDKTKWLLITNASVEIGICHFEGHEIKIGNNGSLTCRQLRINDNTNIQLKNIPIIVDQLVLFEKNEIMGNDVIVRDNFIVQSDSITFQLDNKY